MGNKDFDKNLQDEYLREFQKIVFYMEEAGKGDTKSEEELLVWLETFKMDMDSARKYHFIFSVLIFYLDKSIMLTNNSLRQESAYQSLIGHCRDDIKYYLEVSKILKRYIKRAIDSEDFEHVDSLFLLTVKMGYVLSNISDYLSYIKNMEHYADSFIQYQVPDTFRESGSTNIQEIEQTLKVLGLREENDV